MDSNELQFADGQHAMFDSLAVELARAVGMEPMQLRGFLWRSLKDWQADQQRSIAELAEVDPMERIREAQRVMKAFETRLLSTMPEEKAAATVEALRETWQTYLQTYSLRRHSPSVD